MRRYKLLTLTLLISSFGFAQINSPYTFFGIGDVKSNGVGRNAGMAGVGQAVGSDHFINLTNPAMLANTSPASLTFFDFGLKRTSLSLKSETESQKTTATQLDYFSLAFPLKPYNSKSFINTWYTALGISQYSDMAYDINFSSKVNDTTSVNYNNTGTGGFSMAYWTHSFRVADKLYLGLETGYLFGNIEKTSGSQFVYNGNTDPSTSEFSELVSVSDLKFKPGISYRFPVKLCRTKKVKDIKCENTSYKSKKEKLYECTRKMRYSSVGITSYDTIRTKHLDTLYGSEKKAAERLFRKNQKIYFKKKLEACKQKGIAADIRNNVYEDTLVEAYTLFYGKDIKRLETLAISGKNLTLLKEEGRVFISEDIDDYKTRVALNAYAKKYRPSGYGIIVHGSAVPYSKDEYGMKKEIDSLLSLNEPKRGINKKLAKDYLTYQSNIYVTLGGSYEFNQDLNTSQLTTMRRTSSNGSVVSEDTLRDASGSVTLPQAFHFGIGLEKPAPGGTKPCGQRRKSVWALGLDFSSYQYSGYKSSFDNQSLNNSWRLALGGEITPDPLADRGVFIKRTIYRAGLSYQKMPFSLEGNDIDSYGMTFGLSIPMYEPSSSRSYPKYLNLNFEYASRGYEGGLRENRFLIHLSFAISHKWFVKYKEGL